jgi:hypothetical protein
MRKLVVVLCLAVPLFAADARSEREALVTEIVQLIDVRALTELSLFAMAQRYGKEGEEIVTRVMKRLDYAKVADEVYGNHLRDNFSNDELREVAAFYRTGAGRKSAQLIAGMSSVLGTESRHLHELLRSVRDEIEKEQAAERPDLAVMKDLRTIAVCLEARATDTNEYPKVAFNALPALLEPVYVRKLPRVDPWGTPYEYYSDGTSYVVASAGADRRFERGSLQIATDDDGATRLSESLDEDIVFQNGRFRQSPRQAAPQE